jgi:SAM-dependent methyltransferase
MASDRRRWSKLGAKNPYWASLPEPRFRANRMDATDEEAFFETGEEEVAATVARIRALVGTEFHPARALDFGCGVGRLTIPLARECRRVLAVDISQPMLQVAARNCAERGVENVEFLNTKEFMKETQRRVFDFVHSYFVIRRTLHGLRRWLPPLNVAANIVQRRSLFEPVMPMYAYRLSPLFELFRSQRCSIFNVDFTEDRGHLGAVFFVRKSGERKEIAAAERALLPKPST